MEQGDFNKLQEDCEKSIKSILKYLNNQKEEKFLYGLKECIDEAKEKKGNWSIEKVQVILEVLQSKNPSEIQEIISYFDHSGYGWQGNEYKFYSRCSWKCRKNLRIDNTPEMTEQVFSNMDEIFLHKEYGAITTYLFGYCIASLFSSKLKEQHRGIPYFLQIACKRNSNVYRLVHEIVHICDINTGLFEDCKQYEYRGCEHDHLTVYPSGTGDSLLEALLYYRDIPVIVDGYENEKLYEMLIREVANIPRKIKRLDIKARFNILPVFISPMIQSQFQNVFSIDLTELDIADEYLELIIENEQRLGSWALELVEEAKDYFDAGNSTAYSQQKAVAKIIESRRPEKQMPLFYDLVGYISQLRTEHNRETKLTSRDIENIGYLSYFLSYYMKVFKKAIWLTKETSFTYRGINDKHSPENLVKQIVKQATDSLFRLHGVYSPALPEVLNIEIDDPGKINEKKIEKKGAGYAKDIVKYYKSYKVSIRISNVKYKDERYVFYIKHLPGTDTKLLSRYADEVKRLMEVELFALDISPGEIKLVVSEKPLYENSLIKILESAQFKESEMEIPYAVGYDILGEMFIADIADFPHLLVGGTSGFGKSSALHCLLLSIIYKQPANKVKLLLLDFGASDLKIFDKAPHMIQPTIRSNEIEKGRHCLSWLQTEMEKRLEKKDLFDARSFAKEIKKWPSIVCVIDEFPVFVRKLTAEKKDKKAYTIIGDLLERARKVKIHLVLAAQNASKGNIQIENTNLAAGMAFRCTNWHDSHAIIGTSDAVNLSGGGAMCFRCGQFEGIKRMQGAFMFPAEIEDTLDKIDFADNYDGKQYDEIKCQSNITMKSENLEKDYKPLSIEDEDEELLLEIIQWMQDKESVSNNQLKHDFGMGYDRAYRFLERLEKAGLISAQKKGAKLPRKIKRDEVEKFLERHGHENELKQDIDIDNMQFDKELSQEQNIESIVEVPDNQGLENNSESALSQSKSKKRIKIDREFIKENSSRYKGKKRPAH